MKKIVIMLVASSLSFVLASCSKSDVGGCKLTDPQITAPASEVTALQAYLTANTITATAHPSGFFYSISAQGSSATPGLCNTVRVNYTGRLTNGNTFDSNNTPAGAQFQLGSLIAGWQKGIPLIQKGGKIKLFIPPSLGYGANPVRDGIGNILIPANSILVFDIELLDVL
jgi:FKBP-type peptidyl-prolyl cis-trans isomerase FkpA